MEFGKLADIENVHWSLPPDQRDSLEFLNSLPVRGSTKFYIGTPAWAHKEWIGKIYPAKTKPADFLKYYAENFNTIELNTSHYHIPSPEKTSLWLQQIGPQFRFCPKVLQNISHSDLGLTDKALHREWFQFLERLGPHCGPSFLQLSPSFDYSRKAVLFQFLQNWPDAFPLALEFRHPSWFSGPRILPALENYLRKRNIGLVITDVAGRRDVLHTSITAGFVLLRFIGNNLHPTDFTRAQSWAERVGVWKENGLQELFFFTHEPDDIKAPELADFVSHDFNEKLQAGMPTPQWIPKESTTLDLLAFDPHQS